MAFIAEAAEAIGSGVKLAEEALVGAEEGTSKSLSSVAKKIKSTESSSWSLDDIDYSNASQQVKDKLKKKVRKTKITQQPLYEENLESPASSINDNPHGWSDAMLNGKGFGNRDHSVDAIKQAMSKVSFIGDQIISNNKTIKETSEEVIDAIKQNTAAVKASGFLLSDKLSGIEATLEEFLSIFKSSQEEKEEDKSDAEKTDNEKVLETDAVPSKKSDEDKYDDYHREFMNASKQYDKPGILGTIGGILSAAFIVDIIRKAFPETVDSLKEIVENFAKSLVPQVVKDKVHDVEKIYNKQVDDTRENHFRDSRPDTIVDDFIRRGRELTFGDNSQEFIKKQEGFKAKISPDGKSGKNSIAYGHDITSEEQKQGFIDLGNGKQYNLNSDKNITREEGHQLFIRDEEKHTKIAIEQLGIENWNKLNSNQKEAIVDYVFNVGDIPNGIKEHIQSGDFNKAAADIKNGIATVKGIPDATLKNRRDLESKLFLTPSKYDRKDDATPVSKNMEKNSDAIKNIPGNSSSEDNSSWFDDREKKFGGFELWENIKKLPDDLRDFNKKYNPQNNIPSQISKNNLEENNKNNLEENNKNDNSLMDFNNQKNNIITIPISEPIKISKNNLEENNKNDNSLMDFNNQKNKFKGFELWDFNNLEEKNNKNDSLLDFNNQKNNKNDSLLDFNNQKNKFKNNLDAIPAPEEPKAPEQNNPLNPSSVVPGNSSGGDVMKQSEKISMVPPMVIVGPQTTNISGGGSSGSSTVSGSGPSLPGSSYNPSAVLHDLC